MLLTINGKKEAVEAATLGDLLASKQIEPRMVTVELNGKIIDRADLNTTSLSEGDEIELLYFMGGGGTRPPVS